MANDKPCEDLVEHQAENYQIKFASNDTRVVLTTDGIKTVVYGQYGPRVSTSEVSWKVVDELRKKLEEASA